MGDERRKFVMKANLLSIGDDYWVDDEHGDHAFKVNGKVARMRDTWVLEDASGQTVATIKEKKLSVRDKVKIDWRGHEVEVRTAVGWGDRFKVEIEGGDELKVKGDVLDHEYEIERDGHTVAEVSKKWFRVRDSYGIEIRGRDDPALIVAVAVAVESMKGRH